MTELEEKKYLNTNLEEKLLGTSNEVSSLKDQIENQRKKNNVSMEHFYQINVQCTSSLSGCHCSNLQFSKYELKFLLVVTNSLIF